MTIDSKISLLKKINIVARYVIYVVCISVIALPYAPAIAYVFESKNIQAPTGAEIQALGDELIIPKINVREEIIESETMRTVHEKVWRRPNGSTPDQGSNTILVAHRYASIGGNRASTFYNLPDLEIGDKISVTWKGTLYTYEVFETKTVDPSAIEIENPTIGPILTLYTCTPLWTASQRFVVVAKLIATE